MRAGLKFTILLLSVLTILFVSTAMSKKILYDGSIELISLLEKIEDNITHDNFSISDFEIYNDKWEKHKNLMTAFISDVEINLVKASNSRLLIYMNENDKTLSLSEISILKNIFYLISTTNMLTWDNLS